MEGGGIGLGHHKKLYPGEKRKKKGKEKLSGNFLMHCSSTLRISPECFNAKSEKIYNAFLSKGRRDNFTGIFGRFMKFIFW